MLQFNESWEVLLPGICGHGIGFTADGFRIVYVLIAAFMWIMTALFSPQYFRQTKNRIRYYIFFWLTFLALLGVFLSKDLFTVFIFFELMSFTSYVWVAQDEKPKSMRAAATYLGVAVIGGLSMLMGLFLLEDGGYNRYLTCGLIFFGFAAKAGIYPLHIWLPKAHPVAPAPASALLSGILTKSGIFGILIISFQMMSGDFSWGRAMLDFGLVTMVLGAVLALFSIDIKRTLACSSMSQIGFIMIGIGCGTILGGSEGTLAMRGTMLHMVNHSLIKLVLFMAAGAVYCNIHELDLNKIRGFGRNKLFLKLVFAVGALSISGVPFFSGYASKTLLHEGILNAAGYIGGTATLIEWIFLVSGGCTLAYMLKLYIAVFVERNENPDIQEEFDCKGKQGYLTPLSYISLGLSALVLLIFGVIPSLFMDRIADVGSGFMNVKLPSQAVLYFSFENLKGFLISLIIGLIIYLVIVRFILMSKGSYVDRWPSRLDLEELIYRPLLLMILPAIGIFLSKIADNLVDGIVILLRNTLYTDRKIPYEYAEGNAVTHIFGDSLDLVHHKLAREDRDPLYSYEHRLAARHLRNSENATIITRSLSFGLALASLGLLGTLGYLLFEVLR